MWKVIRIEDDVTMQASCNWGMQIVLTKEAAAFAPQLDGGVRRMSSYAPLEKHFSTE